MLTYFTLLLLSFYVSYSMGRDVGQQQNGNGTQPQPFGPSEDDFDSNDNTQMGSSSNNFQQSVIFTNNGCAYENGFIRENGGPPRRATPQEEAQVQQHLRAMDQYQQQMQHNMATQMQQMQQEMQQMFAPPFPFGQQQQRQPSFRTPAVPQLPVPQSPCFCDSCKRQAVGNQPNAANQYNQYSVVGQGQQRGGQQQGQVLQQQQGF